MFKVIIVDDNIDDREGMRDFIDWEKFGFTVVGCASNGNEGYALAMEKKPDLIVTDIFMSGMDGITLVKKVRENIDNINVIFMSCFDEFEYAKSAIEYNVSAYLLKPIIIEDAENAVSKIEKELSEKKDAINEKKLLDSQIKESLPLLKREFFMKLILDNHFENESFFNQAEYLGINSDVMYYPVLVFLDGNDTYIKPDSCYHKLKFLENMCERDIKELSEAFCVNYNINEAVLFIPQLCVSEEIITDVMSDIQQKIISEYDSTISICIGNPVQLEEISAEFKKCRVAFLESGLNNNGKLVFANELTSSNGKHRNFNFDDVYDDVSDLFLKKFENIQLFVEKYYKDIDNYKESYIKSQSFYILNVINIMLLERDLSLENIFNDYSVIFNKISNYTIVDIKTWMYNILCAVKEYLFSTEETNCPGIVDSIRKNIDENFSKLQTLEEVVAPLYISVGYACRLFKKHTKETIFDYLLKKKMDESCRLLKSTNLKSYQIAEKVGYSSTTYFTTSFKKYTGITPKEYRMNFLNSIQGL